MDSVTLADHLSTLDKAILTELLAARPDVRLEPVPRGFVQLAQRLNGPGSIVDALRTLSSDTFVVGQAIAILGDSATAPAVARLLGAAEPAVRAEIDVLSRVGLAWPDEEVVRLPERLRDHWTAEFGGGRPVAKMAVTVLADELRTAVSAFGVPVDGMRKPELIKALTAAMADPRRLVPRILELAPAARAQLTDLCLGGFGIMFGYVDPRRDPTEVLVRAGLVLRPNRQPEAPREVAVAAWLSEHTMALTGRPEVAAAEATAAATRSAAQAAARDAVLALTTLLDEAGRKPIAMLKKGGVGAREQARLAKRLSIPEDTLPLWIDIAYEAGLLGETDGGYAPTGAYPQWRAAEPSKQWAVAAAAWYALDHGPLIRDVDDDKALPPPLPLLSEVGGMRRATLRTAAADGLSVRGTSAEVDWFYPLHGYPAAARDDKMAAVIREAELLGIVASDRVSELGEAVVDADPETIANRCAALLPQAGCRVILQSDLTAVVSGQPSAAVARLLAAAAVNETRGSAAVWRFSPASVRGALDAGWTASELLTELAAIAERAVPQPLRYMVNDAARRHGQVRVRHTRSCLVAEEALITELLNTRSLGKLTLARLAPTVLSSPLEPAAVLEALRAAGLSPVAEDATGTIVIENGTEHRAESDEIGAPRPIVAAAELAERLIADPAGAQARTASKTHELLADLNPRLDEAELALLTYAVDHEDDVVISYQDKNGNHTIRQIRPTRLYGRWLESFCYLRGGDREFTIANIEAVAPAR